jgi:hypothetical protein
MKKVLFLFLFIKIVYPTNELKVYVNSNFKTSFSTEEHCRKYFAELKRQEKLKAEKVNKK